jgi:outer membrane biosynthesis protein TonB
MNAMVIAPELQLPWESSREEDARYRKILRNALSAFLAFALLLPLLPVEELTREQQAAVPPHLARVILEKKELPRPIQKPTPAPKKARPKPIEKTKPEPRPKPVEKVAPKPKPKPNPREELARARKVAAVSGVLAFQDALSDMRETIDVASLNQAGMSRGQAKAAEIERSVITSAAKSGSGGIKTAELSRDPGGPALSGRETTRVESVIASTQQGDAGGTSASLGGRSDESIRRVMDRNKGAIFAIYNRALRRNPMLQGKLVFEMVIQASGTISEVTLLSSDLEDEGLTKKLLARIRMIRFEAADVIPTRVNYSFDFLPY